MTATHTKLSPPPRKKGAASAIPAAQAGARRLGGFFLGQLARSAASPVVNLAAAFLLGTACVFLVAAWQCAPQRVVAAARYKKLTRGMEGKIVESWLALDLDPAAVGKHSSWQPFSKASRCAVVAYEGAPGAPMRRAFCGTRFTFDELTTTPDWRQMAPGVPFSWPRDGSGFVRPEIRLSAAALEWLATHPAGFAWPDKPPPPTALAALRLALDRPVDDVVVGWTLPVPSFPLVCDPRHPEDPLPAGHVARQLAELPGAGNWIGCGILAVLGLAVWFEATSFLLGGTKSWTFWVLAIVPLLTVPWWGEQAPRALRHLNEKWADVVEIMLDDIGAVDRLLACDPADATLARGERLVWRAGEGAHADTFWRFATRPGIAPPTATGAAAAAGKLAETAEGRAAADPAAGSAALATASDAALAALAEGITARVRALGVAERTTLFERLARDKQNEMLHAGAVFLPAAKEAVLDPQSPPPLRRAARNFLWAWVLTPGDGMGANLAPGESLRLNRELLDVPIPEVANMASAHWGEVRRPAAPRRRPG
jgi:hypothetical protein